jgi:hypothetical protein
MMSTYQKRRLAPAPASYASLRGSPDGDDTPEERRDNVPRENKPLGSVNV